MKKVLIINPGSTSTKIAVFEDLDMVFEKTLRHQTEEIAKYSKITDQYTFRKDVILNAVVEQGIDPKTFDCVVGRGGLMKPIPSGTYEVNETLLNDLDNATLEHASNLGAKLADEFAKVADARAFIVDPVVVDELQDIARISGHKEFERVSIFHALNQKAVAKRLAKELNKNYNDLNLIVVHLGGGISVGAHEQGKVIDVNNALDGDGPFSPERTGTLPAGQVYKMAFSGKYTLAEMKKMNVGKGGIVSYLDTNDAREVHNRVESGDEYATLIYKAMAYQVAKEIGSCATVLKGKVDEIILTGGIAYDKNMVSWIKEYVDFIADVVVYPGEDELLALCEGGLRVLNNVESAKVYK